MQSEPATSAARIENTFPISPIAGPPVHCPTASAWLVIESTVARTPDSSTFRFSHVWKIGLATLRARPTAK